MVGTQTGLPRPDEPVPTSHGGPQLDRLLVEVLDAAPAAADRDELLEILVTVAGLAGDGAQRLNLKITNAALREMREAFRLAPSPTSPR